MAENVDGDTRQEVEILPAVRIPTTAPLPLTSSIGGVGQVFIITDGHRSTRRSRGHHLRATTRRREQFHQHAVRDSAVDDVRAGQARFDRSNARFPLWGPSRLQRRQKRLNDPRVDLADQRVTI